jgi:cell division protein FtsB
MAGAIGGGGAPAAAPPPARGRPTRRPGARRTALSRASDRRFQRRSSGRFTGRAAILALVVSVLVLTLAYPLRQYLAQRAQMTAAEKAQGQQRAKIADLEKQKHRWDDPAYVKAQARKRLGWVEPGVLVYYIKYPPPPEGGAVKPGLLPSGSAADEAPWYGQLWSSVKAAGQPADTIPADAPVLRGTPEPSASTAPAPPARSPQPSPTK